MPITPLVTKKLNTDYSNRRKAQLNGWPAVMLGPYKRSTLVKVYQQFTGEPVYTGTTDLKIIQRFNSYWNRLVEDSIDSYYHGDD
jgi:hypothetical protein